MKPLKKLWDITPAVIIGKKLKQSADQRKLDKPSKPTKPIKLSGEYFSSHPDIHGTAWLELQLLPDGVYVYGKKNAPAIKKFEWSEITGYENETEDKTQVQTTQRLSATRMATMGVFSLAAPKKQKHGNVKEKFYDVLHTTTGDIELEAQINGGGSGSIGDLSRGVAELMVMKREAKTKEIRRFVAEHAGTRTQ